MPQSLSNVLLHIVFSTKNRQRFLQSPDVRDVMVGYLVGTVRNLKCPSLQIGVFENHVHILCNLTRTIGIAKLLDATSKNDLPGRVPQFVEAAQYRIRRAIRVGLIGLGLVATPEKPGCGPLGLTIVLGWPAYLSPTRP